MERQIKTDETINPVAASSQVSLWREIYKSRSLYLFISPFYILFIVFGLFPIIFSLYLSFQKWDGIGAMEFIGLRQFNIFVE